MGLRERMMIVEVGSWTGMSTAVLAKSVIDYHGSVFAADHWMGSEGVHHPVCPEIPLDGTVIKW